jgi:alkylation response protein AidB-like acyl-CoA dehydrogenase
VDFTLSTEQIILRDAVRRHCQDKYSFQDRLAILRHPEGFSREYWKAYAELGWLGVALPEDVGGYGGSAVDLALILEEFGRALVLEPFLSCAVLGAQTVNLCSREEQRSHLLPAVIRGDLLLSLAHFEMEARGDIQFVETRATRRPTGGFSLTGRKSLVLGGGSADWLIVSARTSGDAHDWSGISLFLIRPDAPGLVRRTFRTVDGGCAAELVLADLTVESSALLGEEGQAAGALQQAVDQAIVAVCAEAVGAMDRVVTVTCDYLKTRRAYGTTLSTLQAVQHRLADMLVELELSRSMLYRALAALASSEPRGRGKALSAAKALIGRSGRFVGSQGIQLHGGIGMSDDYIVGHLFKRLTVIETLFGNSDFHLNRTLEDVETHAGSESVSAETVDAGVVLASD